LQESEIEIINFPCKTFSLFHFFLRKKNRWDFTDLGYASACVLDAVFFLLSSSNFQKANHQVLEIVGSSQVVPPVSWLWAHEYEALQALGLK